MLEVEFDSSKDMMFGSFTKMLQFVEQIVSKKAFAGLAFAPKRLRSRSINLYLATWTAITRVSKTRSKSVQGMPLVLT